MFTDLRVLVGSHNIKYRRHTDSNGRYDKNEIKRGKGLNYFKQKCPVFQFAIQTFLRGGVKKQYVRRKPLQIKI